MKVVTSIFDVQLSASRLEYQQMLGSLQAVSFILDSLQQSMTFPAGSSSFRNDFNEAQQRILKVTQDLHPLYKRNTSEG